MRRQAGQATVEWLGLVLVAALVLGALAALRAPAEDHGLGRMLAKRITCTARGACEGTGAMAMGAPAAPRARRTGTRPRARISRAKAIDAFRSLRGAGAVAKRLWIVCLGYRRIRYELDHPRAPTEPMPLGQARDIANACLNPVAFLEED